MNKQKMVREIGRRTRLKNREVQAVVEALVDVWTETLAHGERIEIEHFIVLEMQIIERYRHNPFLRKTFRQIKLRTSKTLREKLNT